MRYRARLMGTRHMAAAGHYLAAQAALQILEAGGNAVDAGVAGGLALGVVQSEFVNVAGVAPIMIRRSDGRVETISGLGWWPRAADIEVFIRDHGGHVPDGILATVMPAAPDAWLTALERHGTMGFGDVATAAIRFARDGFPTAALSSELIASYADDHRRWPANESHYLPGGAAPKEGELFVQDDLGATLQFMADEEAAAAAKGTRESGLAAARDAFYRGDIARRVAEFHRDNGGWVTREDLAEFRCEVGAPVIGRFRGIDVFCCGPWCQGPVLAQTLKILDGIQMEVLGHNSDAYVHAVVEAFKLAYADRHRYLGDPRFVDVPMEALLDDAYVARRRSLILADAAAPGMPEAGTPEELGIAAAAAPAAFASGEPAKAALDTSYVCVVDGDGNAFSATPSDGANDSPVIPGLGIVPSSRGTQSWADPAHPACLAPGKRPRLTPNPAIAVADDRWVMPFGSPGNDVQPQAMVQTLLNMTVFGMSPQDAVEAPRFATFSYPRSSEPHSYSPGLMTVEGRIPGAVREGLGARGHKVRDWPDYEWRAGAVCAVRHDLARGVYEGASDPRRPTGVAGW